eukprot:CAMPEP_0168215900 /NCGR_PEP_ID=MMETSP0140_2-20121125/6263_1 /TAXON_ID=44445 /ORGANISM="Pseudo-nitzschia australis, Strain 10249 10 AB" /LENGTH=243 /DNA_ID=CAMNT_0008143225 /DNA_START=262 /DNA_END=992 /DNA_ORIENTATION=+
MTSSPHSGPKEDPASSSTTSLVMYPVRPFQSSLSEETSDNTVDDLEPIGVFLGPRINQGSTKNVVFGAASVKQNELVVIVVAAKNRVQCLDHGRDSGPAHQHDDFLLQKGSLQLDIEFNVLEINRVPDRHGFAQVVNDLLRGIMLRDDSNTNANTNANANAHYLEFTIANGYRLELNAGDTFVSVAKVRGRELDTVIALDLLRPTTVATETQTQMQTEFGNNDDFNSEFDNHPVVPPVSARTI